MNLQQQIRQHIHAYLGGGIDITAFEDWFVPATWNVDPERDPVLGPLVAHVTVLLVDFRDGEINEAELREQLSQTESYSSTGALDTP